MKNSRDAEILAKFGIVPRRDGGPGSGPRAGGGGASKGPPTTVMKAGDIQQGDTVVGGLSGRTNDKKKYKILGVSEVGENLHMRTVDDFGDHETFSVRATDKFSVAD